MEKKRFLKRKILFIALEILWLVSSLHTWSIAENTNDVVSFEWQDKNYSINAREIAETVNINIDEYPFYIVVTDKQRADIIIYYSKTRFVASTYFDNYAIGNGQQPVFKITVQSDGRVTTKNTELNGIEDDIRLKEDVRFKLFIASNQDLLLKDNKTKAFEQNSGYIYNISNEKEDKCEEMVKIKNETIVYERAAMNHNEMTTLVQGSIVKRIKKEVNVMNGHTWDKIILANGREGYVFSDELEAVEQDEYSNVVVEYKDIKYNVYFPTLSNEVNINEYPFYVAVTDKQRADIIIYYSKTRFVASTYFDNYAIGNGQQPVFKITVQSDGRVTTKNTELNGIEDDIRLKEDVRFKLFIASNQDLLLKDNKTKAFEQNSGYIYDISNEKEDKCEEIVKIKNETIVYERAAMNHNEMTTLVQGSIVKRIKKEVNVMNGHTWDKIVLANGKEGYVFSENLAIAKQEEYSKVSFEYNPLGIYASKYEIYFPTLSYDINIQDYPHYIITADNKSKIRICYSTEEFNITAQSENYRIGNKLLVLMITLEYDGRVSVQKDIRLADSANSILIKKENFQHNCIAANQDIFYENEKIFSPYICEGNVWYRTNVNWDDITMSKGNYNTIKEKEEEFSSVEDVGIAEEALLLKKETLIVALKSVSFVFPHASSALDYFLTLGESGKTGIQYSYQEGIYKAGHTVRLIPINNAIEQNSSIKERLEKNINEVINVAEKMNMSESTQLTFSRTTEDSGIATKKGGLDWHATLNQYRIRMQCAVEKKRR